MKTREQVEQRALELFPIHEEFDFDRLKPLREAYLQGWEDSQQNKQTCGFCIEPKQHQKELLKEMMRKDEVSGMYDDVNEFDAASKTIKEAFDNIPKEVKDRHAKAAYKEHKQLREAAEKVVVVNQISSIRVPIEVERAIEELEKALR